MARVHLCIHCFERINVESGEFVLVAHEWEGNPAQYTHIDCHQDFMKEVEEDE